MDFSSRRKDVIMNKFKNGSTVCFIGDSFVHQNFYLPMIIKNYHGKSIRFVNCGVAGGTATFANRSFENDVLPYKPNYAVVAFGVNDSRRWELSNPRSAERYECLATGYELFRKNLTELCKKITNSGIELILCTPAPYDEYSNFETEPLKGGYALVAQYADFVRSLAKENGYALCDYHAHITNLLQTEDLYKDDRVHPTYHGYYRIAEYFLSLQGITIDAEEPLPSYFDNWRERIRVLRNLYASECCLIPESCITLDDKIKHIKGLLEKDEFDKEYFKIISNEYLVYKEREEELRTEENEIYLSQILYK